MLVRVIDRAICLFVYVVCLQPTAHNEIISHMAKLTDTITVPMARASILWLIGEYSDRVPKIAPDVLRKMAKNFVNEVRASHSLVDVNFEHKI